MNKILFYIVYTFKKKRLNDVCKFPFLHVLYAWNLANNNVKIKNLIKKSNRNISQRGCLFYFISNHRIFTLWLSKKSIGNNMRVLSNLFYEKYRHEYLWFLINYDIIITFLKSLLNLRKEWLLFLFSDWKNLLIKKTKL